VCSCSFYTIITAKLTDLQIIQWVWAGERQGPIKLASACCSASFSASNTHIGPRLKFMIVVIVILSTATCTA
jgi:hypothetical protein